MTGTSVRIIHSGLLPEWMKASMIFSRLARRFGFSSLFDSAISTLRSSAIFCRFMPFSISRIASAPIIGGEAVLPVFVDRAQVVVLAEQLTVLERRQAGIEHDVGFEIENALEVLERHVEQKPDARRQRLQEPDVRDRRGERDVAHALAPHARAA